MNPATGCGSECAATEAGTGADGDDADATRGTGNTDAANAGGGAFVVVGSAGASKPPRGGGAKTAANGGRGCTGGGVPSEIGT